MAPEEPDATIAIITRDRKEELRRAVRSALEQEGSVEVLVIDDGSRDGSAEMVQEEFPEVRIARFDDDADVAARRNDAATLARGRIIISIDDDAVFSSPHTVEATLADLDHPRIAAVAIPYIEVGAGGEVQQRAPDPYERWVTTIFRATAYAIRRDLLVQVGGYTPEVRQFGEEWDLSLKLLQAGYVIRLGRAEPIRHNTSPKRSYRRMEILWRRNELLICWIYFPFPWSFLYMVRYAIGGIAWGFRVGRARYMIEGVAVGVRSCAAARSERRPISRVAFRFDQRARFRARSNRAMRLAEAEAALGPLGPLPRRPPSAWPGPIRRLHAPLRQARTTLIKTVGSPVRCEVCGEVLFRGLPAIWRGRLKLLGAESALVRADWDKMNRLTFRHVEKDHCRSR